MLFRSNVLGTCGTIEMHPHTRDEYLSEIWFYP